MPVPAGGMTTDRVREMLDFYGAEVMLLIGGALLEARDRLPEATAAFVAEVAGYAPRGRPEPGHAGCMEVSGQTPIDRRT